MNDFYHSAPIMINIRLEDIVRIREFRAQRGAGWEGKVGIIIKYRSVRYISFIVFKVIFIDSLMKDRNR